MSTSWRRSLLLVAMVLVAALAMRPHLAFAHPDHPQPHHDDPLIPAAPEIDPGLAIAGLGAAGAVTALISEKVRRRKP